MARMGQKGNIQKLTHDGYRVTLPESIWMYVCGAAPALIQIGRKQTARYNTAVISRSMPSDRIGRYREDLVSVRVGDVESWQMVSCLLLRLFVVVFCSVPDARRRVEVGLGEEQVPSRFACRDNEKAQRSLRGKDR